MKKIVVTFDTTGGSRIEAFGFTGIACLKATMSIEKVLGKSISKVSKSEMKLRETKRMVTQ